MTTKTSGFQTNGILPLVVANIAVIFLSYWTKQSFLSLMWIYWLQGIVLTLISYFRVKRSKQTQSLLSAFSWFEFLVLAVVIGGNLTAFAHGDQTVSVNGQQRAVDLGVINWRFVLIGFLIFIFQQMLEKPKSSELSVNLRQAFIRSNIVMLVCFLPVFFSSQKNSMVAFAIIKAVLELATFYIIKTKRRVYES